MRDISTLYIFLIFIILSSTPFLHAATEQRTALVIGNSNYESGPLKNPTNDAEDIAAALTKVGFKVILKKDLNLRGMDDAIQEFISGLKRASVGLFFFAGHGIQIKQDNYLIPVGAKIKKDTDIKYEAYDVNRLLDNIMNVEGGINIVILDACRDNPFIRTSRSLSRGLSVIGTENIKETFIAYSTGPNQVALDGDGRNSPFTSALLEYMEEPEASIENVFKKIRKKLRQISGGTQMPWQSSSLESDFYFNMKPAVKMRPPDLEAEEIRANMRQVYGANQQSFIVSSSGTSCVDAQKSLKQTEQDALNDAKRKAIEHVYAYLQSEFNLKEKEFDKQALYEATVKLLSEEERKWHSDEQKGRCFTISVKTEVIPSRSLISNHKLSQITDAVGRAVAPLVVMLMTDKDEYSAGEDIKVFAKGNKPFHAKIVRVKADGQRVEIFPGSKRKADQFTAGKLTELSPGEDLKVTPPFGRESIVIYASTLPFGNVNVTGKTRSIKVYDKRKKSLSVEKEAEFFEGVINFKTKQ